MDYLNPQSFFKSIYRDLFDHLKYEIIRRRLPENIIGYNYDDRILVEKRLDCDEFCITVFHEFLHLKYPNFTEEEVEKLAIRLWRIAPPKIRNALADFYYSRREA